ncbi:two-component system, unclassified family, response regulator [Capronia epimyces CBS 606.96]|uniref:Transcription factor n=1 Tax=Capronia epimyces CBS 606.96 TaxID=1182542 RepID=W9YI34_9EURO|nr:two-component system, unclassified family, response regulator [Capronia epimyces CBS 606.96]EXJ88896.1 two-component system, unclassified family, response regulator [Capronia epimyces CBS 606.96]
MLEDPSYSSVVRWGDDGDSFVVLENEKFTKSILPKHFKHSNFASFVRQLNKYDFHKVRQNNEDGGSSIYGANAWEFRHPDFKANSKASLDNIRRKAPAPRKASNLTDDQISIQQIDLMNQQIVAQAQQIESLVQTTSQLQMNHQMVVQELLRLQKTVVNHDRVMQDVMTYLHSVDARQRRDSKVLFAPQADSTQTGTTLTPTSQNMLAQDDDVPASPLQHAAKLLNEIKPDGQFNMAGLEQLNTNMPTPTIPQDTRNAQFRGSNSATSSGSMGFVKMSPNDMDTVVYPMGTTNGIDPMYSEHINNIPYPMPSRDTTQDSRAHFADSRKKVGLPDPGWSRPPRILLVEDDPTCRQIGGKFLYSFSCVVDCALDGLEAVSKMQEGIKYDMILMDIIMPNLDGVSACHIIRQFDRTPIVAMTSNIRSDDIQMYFHHGMDDVLPKPFTRKSLLDMLEKHLIHLKKLPPGMDGQQSSSTTMGASGGPSSTGQSSRDDMSAGTSPAGSSGAWNSPGQYSGVSPVNPNMHFTGMSQQQQQQQYVDVNGNTFQAGPQTPMGMRQGMIQQQAQRRGQADMSGGNETGSAHKRQRIYAPQQSMAAPMRQ